MLVETPPSASHCDLSADASSTQDGNTGASLKTPRWRQSDAALQDYVDAEASKTYGRAHPGSRGPLWPYWHLYPVPAPCPHAGGGNHCGHRLQRQSAGKNSKFTQKFEFQLNLNEDASMGGGRLTSFESELSA